MKTIVGWPFFSILLFAFCSPLNAQPFQKNGLVAFYSFDGNATDRSGGNNDGSLGGASLIPDRNGKRDSAYGFEGNAWINLPSRLLNGKNNSGTVSLWFKANSPNNQEPEYLVAAHGLVGNKPNRIYITIEKGRLFATIGNPSQDLSGSAISPQKWNHVCLVWKNSGNTALLYLNGSKIGQAESIQLKPSIEYISLGSWKQEGNFFHGGIDDVSFYSRALTEAEVQALSNEFNLLEQQPNTSWLDENLIAYFPFNESANDESGNGYDLKNFGATLCPNRFDELGKAFQFDGSRNYMQMPPQLVQALSGNKPLTVSLWCKSKPHRIAGNGNEALIQFGSGQTDQAFLLLSEKGKLSYSQWGYYTLRTGISINDGKWHNVIAAFDGNNISVSVDGIHSQTATTSFRANAMGLIGAAMTPTPSEHWNGIIDDIRIYNRSLSPTEMSNLFDYEKEPRSNKPQLGESAPTSLPKEILDAAAKATPPTNNFVKLSKGIGEVVACDSKGIVLKADGRYLPRIPLTELTENDFRALLEAKKAYDALVSFNYNKSRTGGGESFESQLKKIWEQEPSLTKKVQMRLQILDELRGYNLAASSLIGILGLASNAGAKVDEANSTIAVKELLASATSQDIDKARELRSYGIDGARRAEYEARKDLKKTEAEISLALKTANSAANNLAATERQLSANLSKCEFHASRLAGYGITVITDPPLPIPALSMRFEVDIERVKNKE
jgi:hypothetical protein